MFIIASDVVGPLNVIANNLASSVSSPQPVRNQKAWPLLSLGMLYLLVVIIVVSLLLFSCVDVTLNYLGAFFFLSLSIYISNSDTLTYFKIARTCTFTHTQMHTY